MAHNRTYYLYYNRAVCVFTKLYTMNIYHKGVAIETHMTALIAYNFLTYLVGRHFHYMISGNSFGKYSDNAFIIKFETKY